MLKKSPQQERSRALVDSILEAATRILSARRLHEISTNYIAEVAGVGIGSLYQYFDSKEAIAESLLERHQVVQNTRIDVQTDASHSSRDRRGAQRRTQRRVSCASSALVPAKQRQRTRVAVVPTKMA
jgi:AcrR family transcriptional regulator